MRKTFFATLACTVALFTCNATNAAIIEDFDGTSTTAWNLTNSSGGAPSVVADGTTGNFLRIVNLNNDNNNSIAFDEEPSQTGPAPDGIKMAFDFRMSADPPGGSAADGMGVGLFSTDVWGATGGVNPATTAGQGPWERPKFSGAFTVGLDVYQNIDDVNLNWDGAEIGNADVSGFMTLNDNTLHRAIVEILPDGANATANMHIIEDVHGNTAVHNVFAGLAIPGLDLNALGGYRLIAGGRTGGANVDGNLDNFGVYAVPEPASLTLFGISSLALLAFRRRRA